MNWTYVFEMADAIFGIWGLALIFRKCGISGWWSLVPFAREYKLAKCAGAQEDGGVYSAASVLVDLGYVIGYRQLERMGLLDTFGGYTFQIVLIIIGIIAFVYAVRIYRAFCRLFGRKKYWIICLIFLEGPTYLLWGLSKKFIPGERTTEKTAALSGMEALTLNEGLTINIKERSVRNRMQKKILLRDIHMNIKPGTMVLLLGGSGAGKSTLFNAITGYEKADAVIKLNGSDVYKEFDKMKYQIGFVPQQELMRKSDSVGNTISDFAALRLPKSVGKEERKTRVDEVMERFGLTKVRANPVGKQSGGQKRRISIAMEYIADPFLFILDEPDSGLDGILARRLMQSLHDISREGKIVIVVTHTPDRVLEYFDEVIVLAKDHESTGRLVFHGSVDEAKAFFERETMEDVIRTINRPDEGGEGRADELIEKFMEVQNAAG